MNIVTKIILGAISLVVLGILAVVVLVMSASVDLPQINTLSDYNPPLATKIYSSDGTLLLETGREKREVVEFKKIPQRVVDAFLSAEDDNFYQHTGVDYYGIFRAMLKNIKAGRVVQGGSTITQQVAKSLLLYKERSISRKVKDLLLAQKIEQKFSKEDILFLYLNQVYLGGGFYGVKTAFKGYFNKDLAQATIAESALIAGLLVAPGKYSPYVNSTYSKTRQRYVLKRMFETKKISEKEYEAALKEEMKIVIRPPEEIKAGYFTDWIRQRLMDGLGVEEVLTKGYHVVTTLNWELQSKAEKYVRDGVRELDKRQGYKGSLEKITDKDKQWDWLRHKRQDFADKFSSFLILKEDGSSDKEFNFSLEDWEKFVEQEEKKIKDLHADLKKSVSIGTSSEDKLVKLAKINEYYPAVVTKVNDQLKIAFVDFMGFRGIIPWEGFNWAHPRKISEERSFAYQINKPSEALHEGDVIWTKLVKLPELIHAHVSKEGKATLVKEPFKTFFQSQKYYVLNLEQMPEAQGALFAVNMKGDIITMVGGFDFEISKFNRVIQSNRQPGSSFKPFIYAAGLEKGFTPSSILLDSPQALGGIDNSLSWKPRNYDGEFEGPVTLRHSLEMSRNIPTVRLLQDVGIEYLRDFSKRLKIPAELPEDLSISLGSFGISLYNLVQSFAIFPNQGKVMHLSSIVSIKDREGKVYQLSTPEKIEEAPLEKPEEEPAEATEADNSSSFTANLNGEQVYDPRLSYVMVNLLKGVITAGTATAAKGIASNIGGKTGTTSSYVDSWFVGFSPHIVAGVWSGFDDNKTLGYGETGGRTSLPIWSSFMADAIAKYGEGEFRVPHGIVNMLVDKQTGKPVRSFVKGAIMESFAEGTQPGAAHNNQQVEKNIEESLINDDDYYNNQ